MTASITVDGAALPAGAGSTTRANTLPSVALVVPAIDGCILAAMAAGVGPGPATVTFAAATWLLLTLLAPVRHRIIPRVTDHAGALVASVPASLILIGPLIAGDPAGSALLRSLPLVAGAVVAGRTVSYAVLRRARGRNAEPTLLVGAGPAGIRLARVLTDHPEFGLVPIGFVDKATGVELPLPWLGDPCRMTAVISDWRVRRVIVTSGEAPEPSVMEGIRSCLAADVEVHVVPALADLGGTPNGREVDDLWGTPVVRLSRAALRAPSWRAKRVIDILGAVLVLALTAPVLAVVALAVKLTSRGPILFRQTRLGIGGRPIQVLKFRSMPENSDSDIRWSVANDDRVTPVGRVLRATSLDELPQLFNVLRGDISLVGPRPERPFFADAFAAEVPGYDQRLRVPVGITGWAQIHGLRGDTSIEERATFDNSYIDNWSLRRDLVILVRTVEAVLRDAAASLSPSRRRAADVDIDLTDPAIAAPGRSATAQRCDGSATTLVASLPLSSHAPYAAPVLPQQPSDGRRLAN